MIITQRDIYKQVAEENELEKGLVISIGEFIWKETRNALDEPSDLGVELMKLGTFNLKHKKFIDYVVRYESTKNSPLNLNNPEFHRKLLKYKALIKEIDKFKKLKITKRNLRYGN